MALLNEFYLYLYLLEYMESTKVSSTWHFVFNIGDINKRLHIKRKRMETYIKDSFKKMQPEIRMTLANEQMGEVELLVL